MGFWGLENCLKIHGVFRSPPVLKIRPLCCAASRGSREPGAGSREPGAGSREPGAGEPEAGSRKRGAGSREPGAGSRGAGSRGAGEPGAGEPGAGPVLALGGATAWAARERLPPCRPRGAQTRLAPARGGENRQGAGRIGTPTRALSPGVISMGCARVSLLVARQRPLRGLDGLSVDRLE
jgi:hypothetical protein